MATNLYEYYTQQGQNLPSVKERQPIAQKAGISNYKGTAEQNSQLLSYLKTSQIENPIPASEIKPNKDFNLPQPEAYEAQNDYIKSLSLNLENNKNRLEEMYQTRQADISKQREVEEKKQAEIIEKLDPTKRDTYQKESQIISNQLDAAKTASATIGVDFEKKRQLTSEMEGLLNRHNAILEREAGMPVGQKVISSRTSNAINDITARAGVIEAVFSALDGNISQAQSIINQAQQAVAQRWVDTQNYYGTLLELSNNKLLNLDKEEKEIAENEIALAQNDYNRSLETSEYIKSLMVDRESAQFMADAGVKLNDSIEEINAKMAEQARTEEINSVKNEMATDGYEYIPFPTSYYGLTPITVGGKTLYFKKKDASETGSKNNSLYKLTPTQRTRLLGAGLTLNEIDELHNTVQVYGIESVVNAITDETQKQVISDIYGYTPSSEDVVYTKEENEEFMRENMTEKELKKLSDWLGTSKWFRGKKKDINKFFEESEEEQLNKIRIAIENGYSVDEIISFLNEI